LTGKFSIVDKRLLYNYYYCILVNQPVNQSLFVSDNECNV